MGTFSNYDLVYENPESGNFHSTHMNYGGWWDFAGPVSWTFLFLAFIVQVASTLYNYTGDNIRKLLYGCLMSDIFAFCLYLSFSAL